MQGSPIIGMGGIQTLEDALEFMAGASGTAVGTANFRNPRAMPEIIARLEKYMEKNGIGDLEEIRSIVELTDISIAYEMIKSHPPADTAVYW